MIGVGYRRWLRNALAADGGPTGESFYEPTDAVLAFAVGFGLNEVASWVRSLRSVYSGLIIMVVGTNPTLRAYLRTHGVEFESVAGRTSLWRPQGSFERCAAFLRILERRTDLRNVFLADIDGGLFRADPFAGLAGSLQFYADPEGGTIGARRSSMRALQRLSGIEVARKLREQIVLTPTRIAGSRSVVAQVCRAVLLLCADPSSGRRGAPGADGAAYNLIAHFDRWAFLSLAPHAGLRLTTRLSGRISIAALARYTQR